MSMLDNNTVRQPRPYSVGGETYVDDRSTQPPVAPSPSHYSDIRNAPDFTPLDIAAFAVAVIMIWGPMIAGAAHAMH